MDSHGTLSFQKSNYKRMAELRRHAQTHVYLVRHQVQVQQTDSTLPAQITQYLADSK
jgi:hypothetical protein